MIESRKILLVEDDESLGYLLSEYLKMKDFEVTWTKNGLEGLAAMDKYLFDLAILDVMMPEMDGFTLAREIKQKHSKCPFIFLTSRSMKIDVLKGFSLGAVDYLKKPIDEEELVIRLKTLLNTLSAAKPSESRDSKSNLEVGEYSFDPELLELRHQDGDIQKLTKREGQVLTLLVRKKNDLCSHKEILHSIWGKNDFFNKKSLNVFVSHLRKYLAKDVSIRIDNLHNQGFVLRIKE